MEKVIKLAKEYNIIVVLLVLMLIFNVQSSAFFTYDNLITILRQVSMLAIVGMGMMFCLLTGNVNLSLGAMVSFVTVLVAILISKYSVHPVLACMIGVVVCTAIGYITGWIIVKFKIPALIGTLAMQTILGGLAYLICGGLPVYGIPDYIKKLGQGYIGKLPIPVFVMFIVLIAVAFVLNKTYFGRQFFATGSNEEAARLSGINTNRMRYCAFAIAGFLTGIAGLLMLGRIGSGQPTAGSNIETNVLSAVVIGGVHLSGGEGKVLKAITGVIIIGVINNGLTIMNVSEYAQMIVRGSLFLFAVCFDSIQSVNRAKKIAKA